MTELQNDRQDKNNMPPDLRSRGRKGLPTLKISRPTGSGSCACVWPYKSYSENALFL